MDSNKQFLDELFTNIEINTVIERRKCRATGKVRFNSRAEAEFFILWLKWRYKKWRRKRDRRKSQFATAGGKPKQRYTYNCDHCDGYHITKEHPYDYRRKRQKYE